MTNRPDDPIDPYEPRLTRRVGAFAEQAVRPIDATAIASIAAASARRRTLAGRLFGSTAAMARLGVVLAGALVAVAALGVWIGAGGLNGPGPTQSANGPEATPTSAPGSVGACTADLLRAVITAWEGAAGHRIATVEVRTGSTACSLPTMLQPVLVEQAGSALILGTRPQATSSIVVPARSSATTLVDMANYCGVVRSPLGIRLYLPSETSVIAYPGPAVPLPIDPPPCNGPSQPASIEMQPLQLTAAGQ